MMAAMLVVSAALRTWVGEAGITVGAIVGGFLDTHSASVSVASRAKRHRAVPSRREWPAAGAAVSKYVRFSKKFDLNY
jgi:uncharacterized membrane protein (DUF4010 family)